MAGDIEIKEVISDKSSEFNIKRFKIGAVSIDRPTKVIDAKNITKKLFQKNEEGFKTPIFENSRSVSIKSINQILTETEDKQIKKMFGFEEWLSDYHHLLPPTFAFNPYKEFEILEKISGYFEYYYNFSNPVLFIPNIKIGKYDPKTGKKVLIISFEEYIKFVNEVYTLLNYKNKKPIFFPVSLKLGIDDIKTLAREYIKNEYFYVWFDFEGSAITKPKIGRIRAFLREFGDKGRLEDIIVYSTNIRREIISNIKSDTSPSSDILASIVGSNLIGVNREPNRPISKPLTREEIMDIRKHKARVFDPSTYYYLKVGASSYDNEKRTQLMNQGFNILFNCKLLDNELISQTQHFLREMSIKRYVSNKPMIKEYKGGELMKDLFQKEAKITDWF